MLVQFESNVIYIGTKTDFIDLMSYLPFESNVIYIGTKTLDDETLSLLRLRVM